MVHHFEIIFWGAIWHAVVFGLAFGAVTGGLYALLRWLGFLR